MIGGYVALRNNLIPFSEWEGRVAGGEASNEVVFPRFDDAFGGVADMVLWGHAFKCDVVLSKRIFDVVGDLIINDVEGGRIDVVF